MDKSYATSASERPLSEGAANANVPEDANLDGNGIPVGDPAVGYTVVEDAAVGGTVVGDAGVRGSVVPRGEVSSVESSKSGSELFLLATFALGLVSFSTSPRGITTWLKRSDWMGYVYGLPSHCGCDKCVI